MTRLLNTFRGKAGLRIFSLICGAVIIFTGFSLFGKSTVGVLRLCFEKDAQAFMVSTKEKAIADKLGFVQFKDTDKFIRKMRLFINDEQSSAYKPFNDSCLSVFVPEGKQKVTVDFKSASYTNLVTNGGVTQKYKAELLYDGKITVSEGPSATIEIEQEQNKVTVYQSIDNKPIDDCVKSCSIPSDVPVYFMVRSDDEKVECPVQFSLTLPYEYERNNNCYNQEDIKKLLKEFVKNNKIMCKVNIEYAFFRVYGDGCLISLEPDANGLREKDPDIRMLPLDKQKIRYYTSVNSEEKKLYPFPADRKGAAINPKDGDKIVLTEVKD